MVLAVVAAHPNIDHGEAEGPAIGHGLGDSLLDGRADVVVGANNGLHLLRDVGPLGRRAWPTFHANAQRTGVYFYDP